jgi:GNAT superfamily N-acetyltransferase/DNA-binding MarR family transcriptional regulator
MERPGVHVVRRFNRAVTQRIGALNAQYLNRGRPLGASRVLWEIGPDGSDARSLRSRLELDAGYLSRLLRLLEHDGLVQLEPDSSDKRVRKIRLTRSGRAERHVLDRRSDDLAWSLLAPLSETERSRLTEAMEVVERLLSAGLVEMRIEDPKSVAAEVCIRSYFAELDARFDGGFDASQSISADTTELTVPHGLLLVARLRDEPIGCGALKFHGRAPAEIKRMWVAPSFRGLGVGRRLLGQLEAHARQRGAKVVRLETNRALGEAVNLYRSAGFAEVDPFNAEPYAHHWFEKRLRG